MAEAAECRFASHGVADPPTQTATGDISHYVLPPLDWRHPQTICRCGCAMHYRKLSIGAVNGLRTSHDFEFMIDRSSGRTTFPRPHPAGSSGSTGYAGQGQ